MKYQIQLLFLGIVLFVLIIFSLSNLGPVPYNKNTLFPKYYKYEGLTNQYGEEIMEEEATEEATDGEKKNKNESFKTEGFQGIQSSPYGEEKPIDVFSGLPSGNSCTPSPYSNSKGYLCLDENTKQLLLTRGGNQTCK